VRFRLTRIRPGFDYELLLCSNPWRFFVQCPLCQHVWLNPRRRRGLAVVYPPTYTRTLLTDPLSIARKKAKNARRRQIAKTVRHCPQAPKVSLMSAAAMAAFLRRHVENWGVRAPASLLPRIGQAASWSASRQGYSGFFLRAAEMSRSLPRGVSTFVTMFHVIEHVSNPGRSRRVCRWLSPGGVLAPRKLPTWQTLDRRLFRPHLLGWRPHPRHWNLFQHPRAISRL